MLELLDVLLAAPERIQFSLGNCATLLQSRELLSQLLQRDETLGLLVLVGASLAIYFGESIGPCA